MHLNEIQIFENGINVASEATCYSKTSGWSGNPACLNDGIIGTYPSTCRSHSNNNNAGNYDVCVFDEPRDVDRVVVHPFNDPTRTWMTDRISDLTLEIFADYDSAAGAGIGLLDSASMDSFSR